MKHINEAPFMKEFGSVLDKMYLNGWHERNSGNISYILSNEEVENYLPSEEVKRVIDLPVNVSSMKGLYVLVTGSGKYIKNVSKDPELNSGIIRIHDSGLKADIVWGFRDGGKPTSELSTHLLSHQIRLSVNPKHRVVMHTHATHIMAMTFIHELDDRSFTRSLWKMCTESIVVFPDGIGVLPWMLCGNQMIGEATAEKMRDTRLVVWALHGVFATGENFDDCFGLIETVEKSAQIYMMTAPFKKVNTLEDKQLKELAEAFNVKYRKEYLD
jgi:rhamnulose-1-phosphate aldolase